MAIKDGNEASPLETPGSALETFEVLDEENGLTMDTRGPRRDRWPTNDFY